jgi:prevent-host-death family protein
MASGRDLDYLAAPAIEGEKETDVGLSTNDIRNNFSETLSRIAYGKARIALTRRGKVLALFLPAEKSILPYVTASVPSTNARDNFSEILNRVHYGNEVIGIHRRAATVAIVISPEEYQRASALAQHTEEETVDWSAISDDTSAKTGPQRSRSKGVRSSKTPKP